MLCPSCAYCLDFPQGFVAKVQQAGSSAYEKYFDSKMFLQLRLLAGPYKYIVLVKARGHCKFILKLTGGELISCWLLEHCEQQRTAVCLGNEAKHIAVVRVSVQLTFT